MSLFDWVDIGITQHESAAKVLEKGWKGSFSVTIGNALAGFFGTEQNHYFGSYVNLVCDPEDMLLGSTLEHYLPLVSSLLAGVGGSAQFTYGSNIAATYVGPQVTIRRAPVVDKQSENILAHVKDNAGVEQDAIDVATTIAVASLSALLCATAASLDLAIRFAYPSYGKEGTGYNSTASLLNALSYSITSRLMALIKLLEEKGGLAGLAEQLAKEAKFLGLWTGIIALACIPIYGWAALIIWAADHNLKETIQNTAAALKE